MCKAALWALALALLNSEAELYLPVWTSIIVCRTFLSGTPSAACCRDSHVASHCCNNSSTLGLPVSLPLCFWRCTRQVQSFCNCHWTSLYIRSGVGDPGLVYRMLMSFPLHHSWKSLSRDHVVLGSETVPEVSWPLPEGVSSNGHVSRSAYSCTHGKPSCGSTSFLHVWDVWISSRNPLRIGLPSLYLLPPQCHLASPDNSNTNGGSPSACTPERCSIRIPLQSLLLSISLSRALEFFQ